MAFLLAFESDMVTVDMQQAWLYRTGPATGASVVSFVAGVVLIGVNAVIVLQGLAAVARIWLLHRQQRLVVAGGKPLPTRCRYLSLSFPILVVKPLFHIKLYQH